MATPIAPTPILRGRAAGKFMAKVEDGLRRPVGLVPTPKLEEVRNILNRKRKRIIPNPLPRYDNVYYEAVKSMGMIGTPISRTEAILKCKETLKNAELERVTEAEKEALIGINYEG